MLPDLARDAKNALSVSELTEMIKGTLETAFSSLWVAGEISDIARPHSGHIYLTLKDDQSQIRGVIWRSVAQQLPFKLTDGQQVLCCGGIDVYSARGTYQFVIRKVEPQGIGALQLAFQQLQQRLAAAGLFAPERKRQLPRFPRRVGFVTSPTGAAVRDFLEVAGRRWPGVEILIIPALVQGQGAAQSIAQGIAAAQRVQPAIDVLVVGRGGGSMEDLWPFNEEIVVRAIAASKIPTVSAVGHEIDVTLADFAADLRALTPSAAAEMVIPDSQQVAALLSQLHLRLSRRLTSHIDLLHSRYQALAARPAFKRPFDLVHQRSLRLDDYDLRLERALTTQVNSAKQRWQQASATLHALSPLGTLARGYSLTLNDAQQTLRNAADVRPGDRLITQLAKGKVESQVIRCLPGQ